MYGCWDYSGSHPEVFRCDQFDEVKINKCAPGAAGSNELSQFSQILRFCDKQTPS